MDKKFKITVVVSTYNSPALLDLVLQSLSIQTDKDFEVIVADDGSTETTKAVVTRHQANFSCPLKHAWQEDLGYRLAAVRNLAIRQSEGDYIVFLDGDCIVRPQFVANHRKLAEKGYFVTGTRILVSEIFSKEIIQKSINISNWKLNKYLLNTIKGNFNKFISLLNLPILRHLAGTNWKQLRGCNFAVWKKDLIKVNGLDESFKGWGFEDSDLAVRLINSGIKRKSGKFAVTVFHLWHPTSNKTDRGPNWNRLQERIKSRAAYANDGLIKQEGN